MSELVIVDKKASIDVLKSWAFDLPKLSYDSSLESIEMQTEIKATEKRLKEIENDVLLKVNSEINGHGRPKFSNQSLRDAEVQRRLKANHEYQNFNDKIGEFYSRRDKSKIQAEYYDKMFSVVKNLLYDASEKERLKLVKENRQLEVRQNV